MTTKIRIRFNVRTVITLFFLSAGTAIAQPSLPPGFSVLSEVAPNIQHDMRYIGNNNFLGRPVHGYAQNLCVLSTAAAEALASAQVAAEALGYSLKVYDCYRPQHAVDDFVAWAQDLSDQRMKPSFYPDVPKDELFSRGYIAERSGHSRGSTVDLTLVPSGSAIPLVDALAQDYDCRAEVAARVPDNSIDMGTAYDCFDALSHTANPAVGASVQANRQVLLDIMDAAGFNNYVNEWWHFTLRDEPFPDQFFDFALPLSP